MYLKRLSLLTLMLLGLTANFVFAQSQSPLDQTLRYLEEHKNELELTSQDLSDWVITDQYRTAHNGVTHTYMVQRHQGIKVFNAMITSNISKEGKMLFLSNRFESNVAQKVNAVSPGFNSLNAVKKAADYLGITLPANLAIKEDHGRNHVIYQKNGIALEPIHSELVYQPIGEQLILAWDVYIAQLDGQHAWRMRLDAATGAVIDKDDLVIHCSFLHEEDGCEEPHSHLPQQLAAPAKEEVTASNFGTSMANSYKVVAEPYESPNHGPFTTETTTGNPTASPFGWHSDGTTDYTITRGNNTHTYQDRNGTNSSSGDEPDGGAALDFDFPFDQANEPGTYVDAAVVNLFYWNNYIHDVFYVYGLDEVSGNFQAFNNGNGGFPSDEVLAEAQDNADDPSFRNNANFSSGFGDGNNGRMQMYLWDQSGAVTQLFTVNSPAGIADGYDVGTASFGAEVTSTPVTGDLVLVDDGTGVVTDACDPLVNGADLVDKIAVIDRGDCEFGFKALAAEDEGAIAVIICNNVAGGPPGMAPGAVGAQVTIPVLSLSIDDCDLIKVEMAAGPVNATFVNDVDGPLDYDGDFDNGIIIHEYGHGISIRLTGGPSASCLSNDEQAGEGWSDFFALVLTHEAGDTGADPRGIGTYVQRTEVIGDGIRRSRYSTDMSVNAQTIDDIRSTTAPHPLGEIMAVTLWDLYWSMIDLYGYDPDIYNGTGGNNIALQLVIDGLKMQGCQPGFKEARDAIIAADAANNGGANECLIWATFARRGMGVDYDQGDPDDREDNTPDFNVPEDCVEELKIRKTATENVTTDEFVTYTITVINDSGQDLTDVVVTDDIPGNTYFVQGSITGGGALDGTSTVKWNIGNMADDDELTLTYKVNPFNNLFTTIISEDGFEDGLSNWVSEDINSSTYSWSLDQGLPNTGVNAVYAANPAVETNQGLSTFDPIELNGTRPAMMFSHFYDTERGFDGGLVEFLDGNFEYQDLGPQMIRNGYSHGLENNLVDSELGFTGLSTQDDTYIQTIIDMTDYIGQTGFYHFRSISDGNTAGTGWFLDDIKFVNLYTIPGNDACITSAELPSICGETPNGGTVVYEGGPVSTVDPTDHTFEMNVFPNPAFDQATVQVLGKVEGEATISIIAVDGKVMQEKKLDRIDGAFNLDVSDLSTGVYMVRLESNEGSGVSKLVIQ